MTSWRPRLAVLAGATLIVTGVVTAAGAAASATTPAGGSSGSAPSASPTPGGSAAAAARPTPGAPASHAAATSHATASGGAAAASGGGAGGGDNGTVKIHRTSTSWADPRNEPHVCRFYLDAFGFDAGQQVWWQITAWAPTGDRTTVALSGKLTLGAGGDGHTGELPELAAGHYKLLWHFAGENGLAKQKVFWVSCGATSSPDDSPAASDSPKVVLAPQALPGAPASPDAARHGGLPITGWPLALIIAAAVALLGTGGTALVLARRRHIGLHRSS